MPFSVPLEDESGASDEDEVEAFFFCLARFFACFFFCAFFFFFFLASESEDESDASSVSESDSSDELLSDEVPWPSWQPSSLACPSPSSSVFSPSVCAVAPAVVYPPLTLLRRGCGSRLPCHLCLLFVSSSHCVRARSVAEITGSQNAHPTKGRC